MLKRQLHVFNILVQILLICSFNWKQGTVKPDLYELNTKLERGVYSTEFTIIHYLFYFSVHIFSALQEFLFGSFVFAFGKCNISTNV